jgi:predicted kinase
MQPDSVRTAELADAAVLMPRRSLVVLCGPAGAGKSTFARSFLQHNRLPATVAVSSDACRLALCDDLSETPEAQWGLLQRHTYRLFLSVIDARLSLGRPTLADGVNLDRVLRAGLLASAHKHAYRSALVVFDLSLDTCLAQNGHREPAGRVPEQVIRGQRKALDELLPNLAEEGWDRVTMLNDERRAVPLELDDEDTVASPGLG